MGLLTPSEFAPMVGVTRQAVAKAIQAGRIPVYDRDGVPTTSGAAGRKYVQADEARRAFALNRARIDVGRLDLVDDSLSPPTATPIAQAPPVADAFAPAPGAGSLAAEKTLHERIKRERAQLHLDRERGEMVSRAAILAAAETAGRQIQTEVMGLPLLAEDLVAAAHEGGAPAVSAILAREAARICDTLADRLTLTPAEVDDDDDIDTHDQPPDDSLPAEVGLDD